jgi:hypothetical protein
MTGMPEPRDYDHRALPFIQPVRTGPPAAPPAKPDLPDPVRVRSQFSWTEAHDRLRAYVAEHGKFPFSGSDDPDQAELASWWIRQNMPDPAGLTEERRQKIKQMHLFAAERAAQLRAERDERNRLAARERMRPVAVANAARQIEQARAMLSSPYLLPGDLDVLLLRINNPQATMSELAERSGRTTAAFASKLRGALRRTKESLPAKAKRKSP